MSNSLETLPLIEGEPVIIELDEVVAPTPNPDAVLGVPALGIRLYDFYPYERDFSIYGFFRTLDNLDAPSSAGERSLMLEWADRRVSQDRIKPTDDLVVSMGRAAYRWGRPFDATAELSVSTYGRTSRRNVSFLRFMREGNELAIVLREGMEGVVAFHSMWNVAESRYSARADSQEAKARIAYLEREVSRLSDLLDAYVPEGMDTKTVATLSAARLPLNFDCGLSPDDKKRYLSEHRRMLARLFHADAAGEDADKEAALKEANAAIDELVRDLL